MLLDSAAASTVIVRPWVDPVVDPIVRIEAAQGFVVCVGDTVEPGVQRILDITGLVPVLPVMRGRDEAIEAARSNGAADAAG